MGRRNTGPTQATRDIVCERDRMRCAYCNDADGPFQIHHRRARGMGGSRRGDTNLPANLVLLCTGCHRHLETHRTHAVMLGFLVPQGQTPSSVPVYHRALGHVFLTDAGGYIPVGDVA